MSNDKRVLIFGASGFVGNYLATEFIEHGYDVYGTDIVPGDDLPAEVTFKQSDLLNYDDTESLIKSVAPGIIVNLAGISSVGMSWSIPQTTIQVNVVGALNIMEAMRKHLPETKALFVGSSEEYVISNYPMSEDRPLDASNPYGVSKVTQEQFAKIYRDHHGLKIYYVRPFNHTGIGQKQSFVLPSWVMQVADIDRSGQPGVIKVGNLEVKRDFSHVRDIVRAYRMIAESDDCSLTYNVGSGKAYSLRQMLEHIIGLSDQHIEIEVDPARFRPTDQPVICCDYSLIYNQLEWEPQYTVFDALEEMYRFFINRES